MRAWLSLVLALLLTPALASAQATAKPQTPPPATSKPEAPKVRKEIKVTEKVLKPYVGEYEMQPGRILSITLENGSLWGQPSGQEKRQLFAESQTKFFLKDLDVQLTFRKDPKGAVTGMLMQQGGRPDRELKKVK
jgi:hypothetical protein